MSRYYNKDEIKEKLEAEQIFDLLELFGGEPTWGKNCIVSDTICHNLPGEGSHKLYYYYNTKLFRCFTGCSEQAFDVFELCIKVKKQQEDEEWELYDAMDYIASYFGYSGVELKENNQKKLDDWNILSQYKKNNNIKGKEKPELKEYNPVILTHFQYPNILSWEKEGISRQIQKERLIGYYGTTEQITIPHFDINNRLIGIRGRYLSAENAERYGKYRPLLVQKQLYSHPLSMNLYNLNNSKDNIRRSKTAILFESEKSTMMYASYYGQENDISVGCCGSNLSSYQVSLLKQAGASEIILAFDRQFQKIGDEEFKRWKSKLLYNYNKYKNVIKITIMFDRKMITAYKASPIDEGKEKFEQLLNERLVL